MKPEEKARIIIDRMLNDAGWEVVDRNHYSPEVSAIAVEEGLLKGNREADYLLFLNGKAVGVLEAKKESVSIYSEFVADQAEKYTRGVPHWCQAWMNPLPLVYLSNGRELQGRRIIFFTIFSFVISLLYCWLLTYYHLLMSIIFLIFIRYYKT